MARMRVVGAPHAACSMEAGAIAVEVDVPGLSYPKYACSDARVSLVTPCFEWTSGEWDLEIAAPLGAWASWLLSYNT